MITEDEIKNALKAVKYPGYSRDIVSFGLVKEVTADNGAVSVMMQLTSGSAGSRAANQSRKRTRRSRTCRASTRFTSK